MEGDEDVPHSIPHTVVEVAVPRGAVMREALESLDGVDIRSFLIAWCNDEECPQVLVWSIPKRFEICVGGGDSRSPRQGSGTSGERMEVVDVISTSLVAHTTRRRKDPQEEVG